MIQHHLQEEKDNIFKGHYNMEHCAKKMKMDSSFLIAADNV